MMPFAFSKSLVLSLLLLALTPMVHAQTLPDPNAAPQPDDATVPDAGVPDAGAPQSFDNPYSAYDAQAYEQALQGFVDQQVEYPEDPEVSLNLGSTHYQMRNFEEADRAFYQAALAPDPLIRHQALYNLGNSAFRQGKLQEAVELFQRALDTDPDDQDAKFNLEYVRNEIRRRHEEQQKRQQEQQQNQDQQNQDQQNQDQQQQGDQQQDQQQDQGQDQQEQDQQEQDQQQQDQQGGEGQDSDQDGLSDEAEQSAQNPTDPNNPDSDGDGLPDGQEDQNRNGQVDPGETDPNNPDTDGDGQTDAQEAQQEQQQGEGEAQAAEGMPQEGLTPEEAERYLQALQEGRPDKKRDAKEGRRVRSEKDW